MHRRPLRLTAFLSFALLCSSIQALPTDPDTGFDLDGERENPFPTQLNIAADRVFKVAAWDANNRILIGGHEGDNLSTPAVALIGRITPNGSADPSYGVSGLASLSRFAVTGMTVNDLMVLPDGSALVCGDAKFTDDTIMGYVARLDASGQQDTAWAPGAPDGVLILGGDQSHVGSRCMVVDQLGDGRIVAGGEISRPDGLGLGIEKHGWVELRTADGYKDPSFGHGGGIEFELRQNSSMNTVFALAEQPGDGILVTLGELAWNSRRDLNTVRLGYDGHVDTSFNTLTNLQAAPYPGFNKPVGSELMWSLPNGHIRQAMPLHSQGSGFLGELYWLDAQHDAGGPPYPDVTTLGQTTANNDLDFGGATLAPDGKIVYATRLLRYPGSCTTSDAALGLARLLSNGQADTGFSSDGMFDWLPIASFGNNCNHGVITANDVALSRQGKIFSIHTISQGWPNATNTSQSYFRPLLSMRSGDGFAAEPWDTLPNPVNFSAASARPNSLQESDWVQVTGLGSGIHVPALVLGGELRIGFGTWSTMRWVKNGDWLQVRGVAPASNAASQTVSLLVGGIRGHNSWDSLGQRVHADFLITANQPSLPGARCSVGGLNTNCSTSIPDQGTVSSNINFINTGSCNYVNAVRIGVDIEHSYIGDLRLTLTDPNGQVFVGGSVGVVTLLDRPSASASASTGSCGRNDIIANFDDAAQLPAQTACGTPVVQPALSGDVGPAFPLSELVGRRTTGNNGASSSGMWTLKIDDLAPGDIGQLRDWSLDIECSASAPAISDLAVSVSGNAPNPIANGSGLAVGGDTYNITWIVTNNGPMATSNGRFQASLPNGLTDAMESPAWGCTTSTGGSCTPAIPCFGACLGSNIDTTLSLPVGGTATIFATGTLTELAGDGTLVINGSSSVPAAIGGTRDDNPDNDHVQLQAQVIRITDIAVTGTRHNWQGNSITIEIDFSNLGPSQSTGFTANFALPVGMQITDARCRRGNLPCNSGFTTSADHLVTLNNGDGMLPNRTPYTAILTATWTGNGAPGDMSVQPFADNTSLDPDNGVLVTYTLGAPPALDMIFANGFE